jgi:hypothetical protein
MSVETAPNPIDQQVEANPFGAVTPGQEMSAEGYTVKDRRQFTKDGEPAEVVVETPITAKAIEVTQDEDPAEPIFVVRDNRKWDRNILHSKPAEVPKPTEPPSFSTVDRRRVTRDGTLTQAGEADVATKAAKAITAAEAAKTPEAQVSKHSRLARAAGRVLLRRNAIHN